MVVEVEIWCISVLVDVRNHPSVGWAVFVYDLGVYLLPGFLGLPAPSAIVHRRLGRPSERDRAVPRTTPRIHQVSFSSGLPSRQSKAWAWLVEGHEKARRNKLVREQQKR